MIGRLCSALALLLCVAGLGPGAPPAAGTGIETPARTQQVDPHHGVYHGRDVAGRPLSFTFGGAGDDALTHFTLNGRNVGSARVVHGAWEACPGGPVCMRGHWVSPTHVVGATLLEGRGDWVHFEAHFRPQEAARPGHYVGTHAGGGADDRLVFSHHDGRVTGLVLGRSTLGGAAVVHNRFEICTDHYCVRGHWQNAELVVGVVDTGQGGHSFSARWSSS